MNRQPEHDRPLPNRSPLERDLAEALAAPAPEALAERIYEQTCPLLAGDPLQRDLAEALAAPVPEALAERIYEQTCPLLAGDPLQRDLAEALAAPVPEALAERVYRASLAGRRQGGADRPAVVGRILPAGLSRMLAAAVMLLSVGLAVWMARGLQTDMAPARTVSLVSTDELQALDMALARPTSTIEADLVSLSMEVEDLAVTLYRPVDSPAGPIDQTGLLADELMTEDPLMLEF